MAVLPQPRPASYPAAVTHAPAPKTAWLYIRESREDQMAGHNPETQERLCRELAAKEGLTITRRIVEAGTARTARTRKGWQEVRRGMRRHEFDVLLVWKYSRMHRNLMNQLQTFARAKANGIRILAQADPRDEGDKLSKMSIYITGMFNEMTSDEIREQSMAGTRARALKGMPLVGNAPLYGYRWVEEATASTVTGATRTRKVRLEHDPVTLPRAQAMVRYLDHPDRSLAECAAWMNAQGWPAPRGGKWTKATIRKLINHPYYRGEPEAYRSEMVPVDDPTMPADEFEVIKKQREMAREDAVPLPLDSVPPLLDPAVVNHVRARLRGRASHRESPRLLDRDQFLLTGGLLRCGHTLPDGTVCHGTMGPRRRHGHADFYTCHLGAAYPNGDPRRHYLSIQAEATDRFTVAWLFQVLLETDPAEAALRRLAEDTEEASSERELAESALAEAERKLASLKKLSTVLDEHEMADFADDYRKARADRDRWGQRVDALGAMQAITECYIVTLRRAVEEARASLRAPLPDYDSEDDDGLTLPPLQVAALDETQPWHLTPEQRADIRTVLTTLGMVVTVALRKQPNRRGPSPRDDRENPTDRLHYAWPGLHERAGEMADNGDVRSRTSSRLWYP
jgi:site-specific DNA recombinase